MNEDFRFTVVGKGLVGRINYYAGEWAGHSLWNISFYEAKDPRVFFANYDTLEETIMNNLKLGLYEEIK